MFFVFVFAELHPILLGKATCNTGEHRLYVKRIPREVSMSTLHTLFIS